MATEHPVESPSHDPVRIGEPAVDGGRIRSLYVHAPFCARRCFYCDFAVHVASGVDHGEWLAALAGELRTLDEEGDFVLDSSLDTLYVGGGTPSLLGPAAMDGLARLLGPSRLSGSELEWTGEANPESFTREVARAWRAAGVNRVSLGVQSFHAPSLRWMGRLHGVDGAREAVATARSAGFANLSIDLIFGLPEQLGRDWGHDLDEALALDPPHVSLYGLTVEEETPLGRSVAAGREKVASEGRYQEEYLRAVERLEGAGYEAYEVSSFARPGHESRHNSAYWSGRAYLGLGNGAHSYVHPIRRWNVRDWATYRDQASGGSLPVADQERLDDEATRLERIWLGLRTRRGVALDDLGPAARECVSAWVREALATDEDEVVRLTPRGWLVMDRLTVELASNQEKT